MTVTWTTLAKFKQFTSAKLQWYYLMSGATVSDVLALDRDGVTHVYANTQGENTQPSDLTPDAIQVDGF